jgi:ribosomal protein S18 acetylase RimI-like enzyme
MAQLFPAGTLRCVALSECSPEERARWLAEAERIFFETTRAKSFASPAERRAFLDRWFGNYAGVQPGAFLFAIDPDGNAAGYLAGCIDSFSPASKAIVSAIDYFTPAFCAVLERYPSHFHINVRPGLQGQGIGRMLTGEFLGMCARTGSPGVHVVTGAASRAVTFYESCGFTRVAPFPAASAHHAVLVYAAVAP